MTIDIDKISSSEYTLMKIMFVNIVINDRQYCQQMREVENRKSKEVVLVVFSRSPRMQSHPERANRQAKLACYAGYI